MQERASRAPSGNLRQPSEQTAINRVSCDGQTKVGINVVKLIKKEATLLDKNGLLITLRHYFVILGYPVLSQCTDYPGVFDSIDMGFWRANMG